MKFFPLGRKHPHPLTVFRWDKSVDPRELVDFLFGWGGLSKTYRKGWHDRGSVREEWVFCHPCFLRVAVRNFGEYLVKPGFNIVRAAAIAGNHEDGELFGDRTPHEGLNPMAARNRRAFFRKPLPPLEEEEEVTRKARKDQEEEDAMRYLASLMHPRLGPKYFATWDAYRQKSRREVIFIRQLHTVIDCVRATLNKQEAPREEFRTFFTDAYGHPEKRVTDTVLLEVIRLIEERYNGIEQTFKELQRPHSE